MEEEYTVYRPTKPVKACVAAVALLLGSLTAAFGDDVFSWTETTEFVSLLIESVAGVYAVWRVPNPPKEPVG